MRWHLKWMWLACSLLGSQPCIWYARSNCIFICSCCNAFDAMQISSVVPLAWYFTDQPNKTVQQKLFTNSQSQRHRNGTGIAKQPILLVASKRLSRMQNYNRVFNWLWQIILFQFDMNDATMANQNCNHSDAFFYTLCSIKIGLKWTWLSRMAV